MNIFNHWWLLLPLLLFIPQVRWALFGNDDDGFYGDLSWNPTGKKTWWTAVRWWGRNPCHNLCFYVIGLATNPITNIEHKFNRYGMYPKDVFAPSGFLNLTVIVYEFWLLPFISLSFGSSKFYFGWRERGNFGIKTTGLFMILPIVLVVLGGYKLFITVSAMLATF